MASEWEKLPFSRAVVVNPPVSLARGGNYPFVDMAAIDPSSRCVSTCEERLFAGSGSRFAVGDTLMARITPCLENGKIARFCGEPGQVAHGSTEFIVIRGRDGVTDKAFVYYLTRWEGVRGYAIAQMTGTSGRQRVPASALDHLGVRLPPLPEQRAIAHILGTLDDKIELNRRMARTLEEMARALFKSWFVDFEPVRTKMDGRWRPGESLPGLPAHLYDLFPDRLVDSELGSIPEGWRYTKLGEVADVNWGDTNVTKKSYVDHGFVAFSAKGPDGFLSYYDHDRTGVVISAIGANSGYTWLALGKWSCIKNTIRFWSMDPNLSTEYLFLATHGDNIWPLRGSAQPFISQTDARNLAVLNPSNGTASAFGRIVKPFFTKTEVNEIESRILAALRDALLPKLISGELRVSDAERIAGRLL